MHLLFVYGTLKRGCKNHAHMAGQSLVADARSVGGHRLYDLGDYPGLVPDPTEPDGVIGEIWSVDAAALRRLDDFEGVDEGLYARRPIKLRPPHDTLAVDTYVFLGRVDGRPRIGPEWRESA
ncbi:MAG: gamma-glutamylcyclotransferase family protein [Verrucomicrobiota bacterium]